MLKRLGIMVAALALGVSAGVAGPTAPADAFGQFVRGDYAAPILDPATGRIDVDATVGRLAAAHVNTYAYLICGGARSADQWADLPGFLTAAEAQSIVVWVYLCPPTEAKDAAGNPDLKPFDWDYVTWAQQIASLSLTHPNLRAYAVDDFYLNTSTFTRAYVEQMVDAGRAINPAIRFLPVLYYPNMVGYTNLVGPYRYYIDGVIFPYRNDSGGTDTTNWANAEPETRQVATATGCAQGSRCYQLYFPPNTKSTAGWSVSASQTVTVDPSAPSYGLTLDVWDDFTGATAGYRFVRVLVNGQVVWSRDVAGAQTGTAVTVPSAALTSALAGRTSATLALQMFDAKGVSNFHTAVTFDDLRATGFTVTQPDFEPSEGAPWPGTRSSPAYLYGYVRNIQPVLMVYASKLSSQPAPPTADYVGEVLSAGLNLATEGVAEGTITYALNLTGQDTSTSFAACYDKTATLYGFPEEQCPLGC